MQTVVQSFSQPNQQFIPQRGNELRNASLQSLNSIFSSQEKVNSIRETLSNHLVEQKQEEKEILAARKSLGELAKDLSTEEVRDIVTKFQYLVDSWLDDFERQTFEGKTLQELLHERGKI